jgi:hypothetical protein
LGSFGETTARVVLGSFGEGGARVPRGSFGEGDAAGAMPDFGSFGETVRLNDGSNRGVFFSSDRSYE